MLRELILGVALIAALPATAADHKLYGKDGTYQGRIEERPYGFATYDRQGRRTGWVEEKPYGAVIYGKNGERKQVIEFGRDKSSRPVSDDEPEWESED